VNPLLDVRNLTTVFKTAQGPARAIEHLSFSLNRGRTLGIVGESGCGKSVTALSLLRLLDPAIARVESGQVLLDGVDLMSLDKRAMRRVRGREMAMIFQEPMTSLNPVFTIGFQIAEVLKIHCGMDTRAARDRAVELLEKVCIPGASQRLGEYPHQLSGGMRQRVMVAMALALDPKVLLADEPTTALDVTIQAQILALMTRLQQEQGTAIVLITHDLGVVAQFCDDVMVMYGGRAVELGPVASIFAEPRHPYTRGLMVSRPHLGSRLRRLATIEGTVPSLLQFPQGCRFQDRCRYAKDDCKAVEPKLLVDARRVQIACYHPVLDPLEDEGVRD